MFSKREFRKICKVVPDFIHKVNFGIEDLCIYRDKKFVPSFFDYQKYNFLHNICLSKYKSRGHLFCKSISIYVSKDKPNYFYHIYVWEENFNSDTLKKRFLGIWNSWLRSMLFCVAVAIAIVGLSFLFLVF